MTNDAALAPPRARDSGVTIRAAGRGASMHAARRQCRDLLADACEANTLRLLELCQNADPRVAVVAIKECNDRLWGRVGDVGWAADEGAARLDLSHLSHEQCLEAHDLIERLKALLGHADVDMDATKAPEAPMTPESASQIYRQMMDGPQIRGYVVVPEKARTMAEWAEEMRFTRELVKQAKE